MMAEIPGCDSSMGSLFQAPSFPRWGPGRNRFQDALLLYRLPQLFLRVWPLRVAHIRCLWLLPAQQGEGERYFYHPAHKSLARLECLTPPARSWPHAWQHGPQRPSAGPILPR